ncbi:MAG TPA: COX15/CtaA family protein [Vicinamibacterales bacterium]|jgi:heme A synthase|nr:COX15/CtaA family protein [Vicinamibacterales bacterium]
MHLSRLARYAWAVLAYNIGVILWGAYVRATGSGAGCGSHWPLCNGVMVPRAPTAATLIEFSHRLTSGLALVSVVVLLVWTWRGVSSPHPARSGAALSVFFMLTEAAVGAGLVLFALVADNASMARALFVAVHLLNTFVLLACIALTAWWLSGGMPIRLSGGRGRAAAILGLCAALLVSSSSGAVAALGDTLYPQGSLAAALRADLSPTSHVLIRLRIFHPMLAAATALALLLFSNRLARGTGPIAERLATIVMSVALCQIVAGIVNVMLLAPVWMQMVHLLIADVLWVSVVLLGAASLPPAAVASTSEQSRYAG